MKVVLYGATGRAGSRIMTELLERHHEVTAVVRDPESLKAKAGLIVVTDDLADVVATRR